jgi:hypothetical protein
MYNTGTITETDLNSLNLVNPEKYNATKALIDKKSTLNSYANDLY